MAVGGGNDGKKECWKCLTYICNCFEKNWFGMNYNFTKFRNRKRAIILKKNWQSYVLLSVDGDNDGK